MKNILSRRIFAYIIDLFFALGISAIFTMILGDKNSDGNYSVKFPMAIIPISSIFLYYVLQEFYYNKTIGMRIMFIKIISLDGNKFTLVKAIVRRLFDIIDIGIPFIGIFFILITKNGQRIGDLITKAQIVYDSKDVITTY
ncbi:MAG: RDD family protein [Chitinophagales bacterium]|nr:RDD family protein [Chitinophagales bacterium]